MRIRVLFLTMTLLWGAVSSAQRITLHLRHVSLRKVFDTLEATNRYQIDYPGNAGLYPDVNCWVDSATLKETMDATLRGLPLSCDVFTRNGVEFARITPLHIFNIKGRIFDEGGLPVDDAMVEVKGSKSWVNTDRLGIFRLDHVADMATLLVTGVNLRPREEPVQGRMYIELHVPRRIKNLAGVVLAYNDGYQRVKAAYTTGSYSMEDKATIDKVVSRDLYPHLFALPGLTPGRPGNVLGFGIRDRNTLLSTGMPLLVVDNFPYAGKIDDINVNDLQSITALKDAVAAGVWGAYSGSGVLVLSSREGQYNSRATVTLTMNTTVTEKPRIGYQPRLGTAGYLAADSILVSQHYYDPYVYDPTFALNPAVIGFWKRQNGLLTPAEAGDLNQLRGYSITRELQRYYYRTSASQQYHLSVEGGSKESRYYLSMGYDRDPTSLVRNNYERETVHGAYTLRPGLRGLEIALSGNLAVVNTRNNNDGNIHAVYPFVKLNDASGKPLPVSYRYNPLFIDTITTSYPLDWHYRPSQELALEDCKGGRVNGHLQLTLSYQLPPSLSLEVLGRWMQGHSYENDLYNANSFFVRDLVNTFAQPKTNGQGFYYPVPPGGILITGDTNYTAFDARAQIRFRRTTRAGDQISVFTGAAIDGASTSGQNQRIYGHDDPIGNARMNLTSLFNTPFGGQQTIPTDNGFLSLANRAVSVYSNASYLIHQNYTFYGAFRMDASNFVGVNNTRRWGPFWSTGISHTIAQGDSADQWKPALKVRLSYGCNGSVSNRTAYLITQSLDLNAYHAPQSGILSPPDPSLGWERTYILNLGLDFGFYRDSLSRHGRLSGSVDVYQKRSINLLSVDTLTPSAGVAAFTGNTGGIAGTGIELLLSSVNIRGRFCWTTTVLVNYAKDWISREKFQPVSPSSYVTGQFQKLGKAPNGLFTYQSAGLDAAGNPRGYLKGAPSTDYNSLMNDASGGLLYMGSQQPLVFGSITNYFSYGRVSLSVRMVVKAAYWFERPSINYSTLALGASAGHIDFDHRWLAPGDETRTVVPSFPTVIDLSRDRFYLNSSALATRGDQVRLQDCYLSYKWSPKALVYFYVNNIGLLWRANKNGIDPDAAGLSDLPAARAWSIGVRCKF